MAGGPLEIKKCVKKSLEKSKIILEEKRSSEKSAYKKDTRLQ